MPDNNVCLRENSKQVGSHLASYLIPPCAATIAVFPVFYGFIAKSALQLGKPMPRVTTQLIFIHSLKSSPIIGSIIGTQLIAQQSMLEFIFKKNKSNQTFIETFISSLIVASICIPAFAAFNAISAGKSFMQSLANLSRKQSVAIQVRETTFILSVSAAKPVENFIRKKYNDQGGLGYCIVFTTAALGSLISHPADTALTLLQNGKNITNYSTLMRGGLMRASTVGLFAVLYRRLNTILEHSLVGENQGSAT